MTDEDRADFVKASWVNVVGNAAKVAVEGGVGVAFGSLALIADAAHSVADLVASVVVLVWGQASYDEPDATHPHGHGRVEPLSALFVGAVISLLGLFLLYESAVGVVRGPEVAVEAWGALLAALGFALVSMYAVYLYTVRVEERVDSTALRALARDCLNDIYTSTAAAVGVVGVALGHPILDPVAGGVVSVIVVYQGVDIGRENVRYIVGSAPDEEKQDEIRERRWSILRYAASTTSRRSTKVPKSRSRCTSKLTATRPCARRTTLKARWSTESGLSKASATYTSISTLLGRTDGRTTNRNADTGARILGGMFVTVEGIDGAGKTTVVEAMRDEFGDATFTHEPTESWLGDAVERAVGDDDSEPLTDLFLFAADHADHLRRVVRPALKEDAFLVCDRYVDSRYAYQGATLADRLGVDDALAWVRDVHEPWTVYPDLTLLLDVPVETALARKEAGDKYERAEFLRDVAENYRRLAEKEERFVVIDASQDAGGVAEDCVETVRRRI